jgi:hypothetical protein
MSKLFVIFSTLALLALGGCTGDKDTSGNDSAVDSAAQ